MATISLFTRRVAAAGAILGFAAVAGAQENPGSIRVVVEPLVMAHLSGSQASPLTASDEGSVKLGFGLDVLLSRAAQRWPLELRAGWSMHDHEAVFSTRTLEGDTHFIRGMLSTYRMVDLGLGQPVKVEIGAGLLHSRSQTTVPRVGNVVGLIGVAESVRVIETSPMIGTAASYKFWQGASYGAAARLGLNIGFTEGATTFLLPFGVQITF